MENEVYKAPESDLVSDELDQEFSELASRWRRLGASIIDTLVLLLCLVPIMVFTGYLSGIMEGEEPSFAVSLLYSVISILIFIGINFHFLNKYGQTIGKRALDIRIVAADGSQAVMSNHILKRYLVYFLPNQVPIIGGIFALVNILCIFRKDRRCLHDLFAKTKVVNDA